MKKELGIFLAWAGLLAAYLVQRILSPNAVFILLIPFMVILAGCYLWATGKHRSPAYMIWGLIAPIGFLGIALLKEKDGDIKLESGDTQETVEAKIAPVVEKALGSKSLAQLSRSLLVTLRTLQRTTPNGEQAMRTKIIKSVEDDARRTYRQGGEEATEKLLQEALHTPEYMMLLKELGMDEYHLRDIIQKVHAKEIAKRRMEAHSL